MYIYVYIESERERERERDVTYIYYISICPPEAPALPGEVLARPLRGGGVHVLAEDVEARSLLITSVISSSAITITITS